MSNLFTKEMRLRTKREFQRISRYSSRLAGKAIVVDYCQNRRNTTRLGVTVTKKYGKAHERNRFKRIVREAFRLAYPFLPAGFDLNVRPRTAALTAKMNDVLAELKSLLDKV